MKIISLQLTKILAEKKSELKAPAINNDIRFTNVEKESLEILKDHSLIKLNFTYSLSYTNSSSQKDSSEKEKDAEILFEGFFLLSISEEEQKEFEKSWKKKSIPEAHMETLFNAILRRCTAKAVPIQEELNIPSPFLNVP